MLPAEAAPPLATTGSSGASVVLAALLTPSRIGRGCQVIVSPFPSVKHSCGKRPQLYGHCLHGLDLSKAPAGDEPFSRNGVVMWRSFAPPGIIFR